jgi:acid phosphatase type 7
MERILATVTATLTLLTAQFAIASAQKATSEPDPIGILLAAGDIANCNNGEERMAKVTGELALGLAKEAEARNIPVRVLALGDLAYPDGTKDDFKCFDSAWGERLAKYLLPVPGNHEYNKDPNLHYFEYFKTERSNPLVFQQGQRKGYFSINFPHETQGPWRLIGLNSELKGSAMGEQVEWLTGDLDKTLENAQKPGCVLAFWHKPVLSSGMHGHGDCNPNEACKKDDADLCRPENANQPFCKGARTMLPAYRALFQKRASVVLAGHDHHYEQFARHDPNGKPNEQGLRAFIVGTGGKELYATQYTKRWGISPEVLGEVYNHKSYGVLRIALYPDRYSWSFVSIAGAEFPFKDGLTVNRDTCNPRP